MSRRWRLASPLLPLLLVLAAGCEGVVEPAADPSLAPRAAERVLAAADGSGDGTVRDAQGHEYTLVETAPLLLPDPYVSAVLGAAGGVLRLAGHTLSVPAGAVQAPTVFLMVVLPDGRVEVELRALVSGLFGALDVGGKGFARPVSLSLSYAGATHVVDPAGLTLLHLRPDGVAEPLPSTVDPAARTVTARLEHFSRYCMAIP